MSTAFIFPGQGSQAIGMAQALAQAFPVAREVLQEVDEALGQSLSTLMFEGPLDALTLTQNAQPAIMAASLAAFRVMETEMGVRLPGHAVLVAGHSLGEYSALTAAGSFTITQAARLLRIRGNAMQEAVPAGEGGMAAIIGLELPAVREVVQEAGIQAPEEVIEIANHNAPTQIVVSGTKGGIEKAMVLAKEHGAKRALPLSVSAPFHCSMMKPAADAMREALASETIQEPAAPVVANVTAQAVSDANQIRHYLVEQVTSPVRWVDSIQYMQNTGVTKMVEIGHGQVLSGLVKRIAPEIQVQHIGAPEDLEAFAKAA
jgi:[acyl-carrier-protein] S-malonyltransferase